MSGLLGNLSSIPEPHFQIPWAKIGRVDDVV